MAQKLRLPTTTRHICAIDYLITSRLASILSGLPTDQQKAALWHEEVRLTAVGVEHCIEGATAGEGLHKSAICRQRFSASSTCLFCSARCLLASAASSARRRASRSSATSRLPCGSVAALRRRLETSTRSSSTSIMPGPGTRAAACSEMSAQLGRSEGVMQSMRRSSCLAHSVPSHLPCKPA